MSKLTALGRNVSQATSLFRGAADASGGRVPKGTISVIGNLVADGHSAFQPTYNGALHPTIVGSALSDYLDFDPVSFASSDALTNMKIYAYTTSNNCQLWIVGTQSGSVTNLGSGATPLTKIFDLNVRPDTISIFLTSPVAGSIGGQYQAAYNDIDQIGSFTDSQDFNPTNFVQYGWEFESYVRSTDPPQPSSGFANQTPLITFTFKKAGYETLAVTYKLRCDSQAEAEGFPF